MEMNTAVEEMNRDLLALYDSKLPHVHERIQQCIENCPWESDKVSQPFLMQVEEEYLNAKTKILFVGRETYGWGEYNKRSVGSDLMSLYNQTSMTEKHFNSPFWWFREQFSKQAGIDQNFMKATLWTNLSKIDVHKNTPKGIPYGDLQQEFIQLLMAEIAIVKPVIVLIMTTNGHYNWHINNYNWLENKPYNPSVLGVSLIRKPILTGKIDQLIALGTLPEHTYQICHPNALRRKVGGYKKNADELIQVLAQQIKIE